MSANRRSVWLASVAGVLVLAVVAGWAFRTLRRDNTAVQPVVYDFGQGRDGETIEHTFHVENPSNVPLVVKDLKSSCTCTVSDAKPGPIAPRGRLAVPVKVRLNGDGPFRSTVYVSFSGRPAMSLTVRGNVVAQYPHVISFGEVRTGEAASREFFLRSASASPLVLKAAHYDPPLNITHDKTAPNDPHISVKVALNDARPGPFSQQVRFVTNDEKKPEMVVRVEGYVVDALEPYPRTISFGLVAPGDEKTVQLTLTAPYGGRIRVEEVTSPVAVLTCDARNPTEVREGVSLPVVLRADFAGKVLKSKVTVKASVDDKRVSRDIEVYAIKQ